MRRRRKARGALRPRTAAAPAPADDVGVTVTERDSPEMAQKKAEIKPTPPVKKAANPLTATGPKTNPAT